MSTRSTRHSVSVAAIISDDHGMVLLIQRRDNGMWEPPGGVLEVDESIHDGLRREIREETGLDVEPAALTGVYKNMRLSIIALVFRCHDVKGTLTPNHEVTAFRWARPAEIPDLLSDAYAIRVLDALTPALPPAIREHDGVIACLSGRAEQVGQA